MIATDTKTTREYVLRVERDLPEGERTTWILRTLSAGEKVRAFANGAHDIFMEASPEVVDLGVVGWRNFKRHDGSEVPRTVRLSDALGDPATLAELAGEILGASSLTEEDRKNSESSPSA